MSRGMREESGLLGRNMLREARRNGKGRRGVGGSGRTGAENEPLRRL